MAVGLLGILKAGGAYLPLDPLYPPDRLAFMLEDARPIAVLTQRRLEGTLPHVKTKPVFLDDLAQLPAERGSAALSARERSAGDLAYVIYTSGSTGTPKGVQVTHRSIVNFLFSMRERPGLTETDRLLATTTLSFDIAGLEFFLPLTVGALVAIASVEAYGRCDAIGIAPGASPNYCDAGDPGNVASAARSQLDWQSPYENILRRRDVVVGIGGAVAAALRIALEHVWTDGGHRLVVCERN